MTKIYTRKTLAESLGMSTGLLIMEEGLAKIPKKTALVDSTWQRVFDERDRQAIIKCRKQRGLETPPAK